MKNWKQVTLVGLCMIMILSATACGGSKQAPTGEIIILAERQYSFWFRAGNEQYADYEKNPGVDYFQTRSYGQDEDGNDIYIDLVTYVPVTGGEADNFNTLIATGEYMDVMDLTAYSGTVLDLYEEGVAMDITEWVESSMPNYTAFLDANPNLKATATNLIDGEKRYLQIMLYLDDVGDMWGGYQYRRDWIVKYGKNPVDGSAFSGAYTTFNADGSPNLDSWEDNVVFPSGGAHPVYISDWEWMFKIFDIAMEDLGITDGYGMSLYYPGFLATGDLVCAFGGGNATWHKTPDNTVVNGAVSDSFRTYLQAMNTWYQNGWIDTGFAEHTSDIFYQIDNSKIFSGKVGLWWGLLASLGGRLADPSDPYLDGFVAYTAAQPINDIYGSENEQNKTPFAMYQQGQEIAPYMVTTSVKDKDLETFFTFLDYLYSTEGSAVRFFGLSKEQYELTQNEFMTENGLTEGAYSLVVEDDGVTRYQVHQEVFDKGLENAVKAERFPGIDLYSVRGKAAFHPGYVANVARWTQYKNTGWLPGSFTGQLSAEDLKTQNKINTNISEFMTKNIPSFIKGTKDPFSDADWNAYVNALSKYGPDKVTSMLQALVDQFYGN